MWDQELMNLNWLTACGCLPADVQQCLERPRCVELFQKVRLWGLVPTTAIHVAIPTGLPEEDVSLASMVRSARLDHTDVKVIREDPACPYLVTGGGASWRILSALPQGDTGVFADVDIKMADARQRFQCVGNVDQSCQSMCTTSRNHITFFCHLDCNCTGVFTFAL